MSLWMNVRFCWSLEMVSSFNLEEFFNWLKQSNSIDWEIAIAGIPNEWAWKAPANVPELRIHCQEVFAPIFGPEITKSGWMGSRYLRAISTQLIGVPLLTIQHPLTGKSFEFLTWTFDCILAPTQLCYFWGATTKTFPVFDNNSINQPNRGLEMPSSFVIKIFMLNLAWIYKVFGQELGH